MFIYVYYVYIYIYLLGIIYAYIKLESFNEDMVERLIRHKARIVYENGWYLNLWLVACVRCM